MLHRKFHLKLHLNNQSIKHLLLLKTYHQMTWMARTDHSPNNFDIRKIQRSESLQTMKAKQSENAIDQTNPDRKDAACWVMNCSRYHIEHIVQTISTYFGQFDLQNLTCIGNFTSKNLASKTRYNRQNWWTISNHFKPFKSQISCTDWNISLYFASSVRRPTPIFCGFHRLYRL